MASHLNAGESKATTSELARIWQQSILDYEKLTGKVVKELPQPSNMDEIISFADRETKTFIGTRHPAGKLNAVRTYLGKNIDYIDTAAEFIADATAAVFPPTKAIYAVISYLLKTAKKLSAALDMIAKSFDEMNTVLERINFLDERRLPNIPGYKICIGRVFTSLMAIFGISTCYLKSGRAMKFFSRLVKGDDDALQGAYDTMIQSIQRLDPATNMATLRKVGDVEIHLLDTQTEIRQGFDISEAQQKAITSNTEEILNALARYRKEVAMFSAPKPTTQAAKDKEIAATKDGTGRKAVALNKIRKFFANPTDPSIQLEDISQFFVEGTSGWFGEEVAYDRWFDAPEESLLVITAAPGLGKSFTAYSIIGKLQDSCQDNPRRSVAYFFFKEEHGALTSLRNALSAMVMQIAEKDVKYCEQVAMELDSSYDLDDGDTVTAEDNRKIWSAFFQSKFPSLGKPKGKKKDGLNDSSFPADTKAGANSEDLPEPASAPLAEEPSLSDGHEKISSGQLYMVFDGLDQMAESDVEAFLWLVDQAQSKTNIKVLLTCRPSLALVNRLLSQNVLQINIDPDKANEDVRRIVTARCESLSRIRKLRPHTKRSIIARLTFLSKHYGTGKLYTERVLQYLDSIGREGAVISVLHRLPHDLPALYASILADCNARRSPAEAAALKLFYASIAYSRRPLTLKESKAFMSLNVDASAFDVDDEIRNRSVSILDLFRSLRQDGRNARNTETDEEETSESKTLDVVEEDEDDNLPLNFQERSLREFFRNDADFSSPLKLGSFDSNLALFTTTINVICGTPAENSRTTRVTLENYAVGSWLQHLRDLDAKLASDAQVVQVVDCLVRILTNINNAAAVIERNNIRCYDVFNGTEQDTLTSSDFVSWAQRAVSLPENLLSLEAGKWASATISDPSKVLSGLARGHVRSWFAQIDIRYATKSFQCARLAIWKTIPELLTHAASIAPEEIDIMQVAGTFKDIKIEGKAHLAIALTLQKHELYQPALVECKKALDELTTAPVTDRFYTYLVLGQIARSLAGADDYDSDDSDSEDEDELPESELNAYATAARDYAYEALRLYPKSELSALSDYLKWFIQEAHTIIGAAQRKLGNLDDAIGAYQEARTINFRQGYLLQQITSVLDEQEKMSAVIERVEGWTTLERSYWLAMNESDSWDTLDLFQRAAKQCGKEAFMTGVYQELITLLDRDGNASNLKYQLADTYLHVLNDPAKAKPLLNDLLDGEACKNIVTGLDDEYVLSYARDDLSQIIYEDFRQSADPTKKAALLQELADIPKKQLASTWDGYEIADSPLTIPLARMTRKMGPERDYQKLMDDSFDICMGRLSDMDDSNDAPTFHLLSKLLGVVGGMERDAQIALSLEFSKIDPSLDPSRQPAQAPTDAANGPTEFAHTETETTKVPTESAEAENGAAKARTEPANATSEAPKAPTGAAKATTEPAKAQTPPTRKPGKADSEREDESDDSGSGGEETDEDEDEDDEEDKDKAQQASGHVESASKPESSEKPLKTEEETGKSAEAKPAKTERASKAPNPLDGEEITDDWRTGCEGECEDPNVWWSDWRKGGKMYLCVVCADVKLCEACYRKRMGYNAGEKRDYYREYCGRDHEYVCGPIEGWAGVRQGMMRIGQEEIPFQSWLGGVQRRWAERWVEFWRG